LDFASQFEFSANKFGALTQAVLQRRGELERCGGAPYLASLADDMPRVSNVEYYARIVKEKANLRRIAHAAERARDLALSANGDAAAILSEIASLCRSAQAPPTEGRYDR
jgi:Replicative DNA helicase